MTQVSSLPGTAAPDAAPVRSRARRWRRALPAACLVAALAALGGGLAQALLSAGGSGTGSATTGSIGVNTLGVTTQTCTYTDLQPGDLVGAPTEQPCVLDTTYEGNVPAWISLTVEIASVKGSGTSPLYDGSNLNGLTFSISDGTTSYDVPAGPGTPCLAGTCWTAPNDLAAWYDGSTPKLAFNNGDKVVWTVTPMFDSSANDNKYQGGSATLTLVVNAVQSQGNPLPGTCNTTTIGKPCPTATWSS